MIGALSFEHTGVNVGVACTPAFAHLGVGPLSLVPPVWWVWEGFLVCGVCGSGCMVRHEGRRRFSCLCHRMGSTGRRQRQIIGGPVVDTGLYACTLLVQQPVSRMVHVMFSSIKTPPPPPPPPGCEVRSARCLKRLSVALLSALAITLTVPAATVSAQTPPEPDPVVTLSLENSSGISSWLVQPHRDEVDYTLRYTEWDGTLTFRVHVAPAPAADLMVDVSAVSGGHFLRAADVDTTVTVTAGTTGTDFTLNVEDDSVDEGHDFLVIEIQPGSGYTVGGPRSYRGLYIYDNDPSDYLAAQVTNQLGLRVSRSSGEEGEGYLKVKLVKNFTAHVDYRICRGTSTTRADASPGADYDLVSWRNGRAETWVPQPGLCVVGLNTAHDTSWWLKVWDDSAVESEETVELRLFADGDPWPTGVTSPAGVSLVYRITDNDVAVSPQVDINVAAVIPVVSLRADAVSVPEGGDVTFTVTAAPAPAADLVVNVFAEEESGSGLGFRGMGRRAALTVPAGESTVSWTFTTMSDDADHPDGRVDARIDPAAVKDSYTIGEASTATVTIHDDDDPAPNTDPAPNADPVPNTVDPVPNTDPVPNADPVPAPQPQSAPQPTPTPVPQPQPQPQPTRAPTPQPQPQPTRAPALQPAPTPQPAPQPVVEPVTLTVSDAEAAEGRTLDFVITLNRAARTPVEITYSTLRGEATDDDYTHTVGTITINTGETRRTVHIRTTADDINEQPERMILYLVSVDGAEPDRRSATGTINNN